MRSHRFVVLAGIVVTATGCLDSLGFGPGPALSGADTVVTVEPQDLSAGGSKLPELPAPPINVGPLLLQASVAAEDTSSATPPMSLRFNVTATNPADTSVTLDVDGCTVWPDVYETPDRSGQPLWVPQGQCAQAAYSRVIASQDSTTFAFVAHNVMLADALPDGRYYVSARFRQTGQHLVLNAGHADVRLREPGLSFRVAVSEEGDGASARVVAINSNGTPLVLEFGACALGLALFRDSERTRRAASWRSPFACPAYLVEAMVLPGDSLAPEEFAADFDSSFLEDVEVGGYHLAVELSVNWRTYTLPAGVVVVR